MVKRYINGENDVRMIDQYVIKSDKYTHNVTSKKFLKMYKVVSDKRRLDDKFTYPYGYCNNL